MDRKADFRNEYIEALRYYCWKHSIWDTEIVDRYFQLLIDVNNPSILTEAVTRILFVCLFLFHFVEVILEMIVQG